MLYKARCPRWAARFVLRSDPLTACLPDAKIKT